MTQAIIIYCTYEYKRQGRWKKDIGGEVKKVRDEENNEKKGSHVSISVPIIIYIVIYLLIFQY